MRITRSLLLCLVMALATASLCYSQNNPYQIDYECYKYMTEADRLIGKPGIPASEAEHIFERFVKLDSFVQGTGLGLSICRQIAQALGGSVYLDTDYTGGARFVFNIPLSGKTEE